MIFNNISGLIMIVLLLYFNNYLLQYAKAILSIKVNMESSENINCFIYYKIYIVQYLTKLLKIVKNVTMYYQYA